MTPVPRTTTVVEYNANRGMWCVTVYHNGVWYMETWFHTETIARQWAAEVEAAG